MKLARFFPLFALLISFFGLNSPGFASSPALDSAFVSTIGAGLTPEGYPTFDSGTGATNAVVLQSDGKIIAGGNVSKYNKTGNLTALKRLNSDGSLDSSFNSGGSGLATTTGQPEVHSLLAVSGDKVYVGGTFDTYNGVTRNGLLRLNADGSLDTAFNTTGLSPLAFGVRYAQALAVQPDGKILVGGGFSGVSGTTRYNLARLNADGSMDTSFNAPAVASISAVVDIQLLADGRLYVCGARLNSALQRNDPIVYRLNSDGSLDPSFNISWGDNYGAINQILGLPDGRLLVSGSYAVAPSTTIRGLAAFNSNGQLDTAFDTNLAAGPNGWTGGDLKLAPDGTIYVCGIFTQWNGSPRASIARLSSDGTLDPDFNPPPYLATTALGYISHLYSMAFQDDGKIVVGGWFSRISDNTLETFSLTRFLGEYGTGPGTVRMTSPAISTAENAGSVVIPVSRFGGLIGSVSVTYSITPLNAVAGTDYTTASGTLTWNTQQGGIQNITIPILQDVAQDGLKAFNVTLSNVTGGATLPAANSTTLVSIRDDDAPPVIVLEPVAVSLDQGANFSLVLFYDSVLPATVQWQRDTGSGFTNIAGATSQVYLVSGADPALNGGTYRAIVTNANGSDTSLAVAVTVNVPAGSVVTSFVPPSDTPFSSFTALDSSGRFLIGNGNGLRRLKADGTLDPTATFGISVSGLSSILPLADGRTLLGGNLGTLTHLPSNTTSTVGTRLIRLNADGTIDGTYTPSLNGVVSTLAAGASGKFYAGVYAATSVGLQRFLSTGAADSAFNVPSATIGNGTAGNVLFVKEQADGKVLVAHISGNLGFSLTYRLSRLTSAGALDTTFGTGGHVILPTYLTGFDVLPDGRIVIAARFNNAIFPGSQYLALLNANGSQDTSFQFGTGILNSNPLGVTYRDGRLLVWGNFTTVNGVTQGGLVRLNLDGSVDATFAAGAGSSQGVASALYTASGDIFIAGSFTSFKAVARRYAALLVGGPGALSVSPAAVSVLEGAGTATVTVKRFGTATSAVSVSYATIAETATAPADFTAASGTLNWAANETADKTISITLANNATGEPNETFRVRLSAITPANAATLALADAVVTIVDDDNPPSITTHPVSQLVGQGTNVTFTVVATSVPAATYRWTFNDTDLADGSGVSGSGTATLTLTAVGPTRIGTYRCRVTNTNGPSTSDPASLDIALNPAFTDAAWPLNLTINGTVNAIVPLPDGGAYVAGQFTNFNGQTGRSYLVKISSTGVVDTAFSPAPNTGVTKLVLDGDRLYAFGTFTQIGGGAALNNFAALDATTGLRLGTFMTALGTGANGTVRALTVLSDGDLLLGGDFTSYNANTSHHFLARINSDGSLHSPFSTVSMTGSFNVVSALGAGSDGTFVAGGSFTYGTISRFARFNADGSRDASFAPTGQSTSTTFTRIRILSDGRVMASGGSLPPSNRGVTRLSATGVWDSADFFGPTSGTFNDFVLQSNGRSVGVGSFTFVGTPVNFSNLASFSTVGALEQTWVGGTGFDNTAQTVALAENGRLWIGGDFTTFNSVATQRLIRLNGYAIPLAVTLQPKAVETNPATTATFTARATGTSALTYRWLRNGVDLTDGGNISGSGTATLSIANVTDAAEDVYSVRVNNLSGTTVSNGAALVVLGPPEILTQPAASLVSYTGRTFSLEISARGIAPLTYQWRKGGNPISDGSGITGTSTATLTFASLTLANTGEYDVIVTGTAATPSGKFNLTVLPNPVERVATFSSLVTSTSQPVYTILPLADGGALIGGRFNALNGASATTTTARIARVLPDGSVASVPFTTNGDVRDIVRLPGGKFLVAGEFSLVTPTGGSTLTRNRLIRLNADFSLDTSFDPGVTAPASSYVYSLAVDSLGHIYAAGDFASWNGNSSHSRLVRLRPDGSHDTSFTTTFNNFVRKVVVTAEGKIYAGGNFTNYQGRSYFVRLTENGTLDSTFAPSLSSSNVSTIIAQPDGKIFAINGTTLSRFLDTGVTDTSFPSITATGLNDVTLQPDGRVIISGSFTTVGGITRYGLMRLSSEGAVDPTFDVTGQTTGLAFAKVDGYGRVWLGGTVSVYGGVFASNAIPVINGDQIPVGIVQSPDSVAAPGAQNAIFKVTATGTSTLSYQWLRNGSPLATDAHFSGTNTATLTILGVQPGDEALYSVTVTNTATSAFVTSSAGEFTYLAGPEILTTPVALTAEVGQAASFFVEARGAGTLTYEWLKGTTVLANSPTISGATTNILTLSNLALADGGSYSVRVTNTIDNASTTPAVLTVVRNPAGLAGGLVIPTFNNTVNTVLPLADGTFLAGGAFTTVTYPGGSASRNRFAKIKADGSADTTWPVVNNAVTCIARDSSGRIYLGGFFTTVTPAGGSAITRNRLLRLSATGVLDTNFDPLVGPNSNVLGIKFDSTGRIYVFGEFSSYRAEATSGYIVRLNEDGSRDSTFVSSGNGAVQDIEFTSAGNLWLAHPNGWLSQFNLVQVDTLGAKVAGYTYSGNLTSYGLGLLPDDSVLNIGNFSPFIQKVSPTGAVTSGFPVGGGPNAVISKHAASGSQFYLQGSFTTYGGTASGNLVRINADGTRDATFDAGVGFNGTVENMVADTQGRLWCVGSFVSYKGDTNLAKIVVLNGGASETNSGPVADPLDTYLENAGVPADQRGPNDDPDRDGLPNLLEYALGHAPNTITLTGLPDATVSLGNLTLTYKQAAGDITYTVETNPNLTNPAGWTSSGVNQGTPDGNGNTTATVPATGPGQFLRLRITR